MAPDTNFEMKAPLKVPGSSPEQQKSWVVSADESIHPDGAAF